MEIKGVVSKSEDVFFFTASIPLLNNGIVECKSPSETNGSPLFTELFNLPWVKEASAEGRALIVKKKEGSAHWQSLAPEIAALIRKLHQENVSFFTDAYPRKKKNTSSPASPPINENNINTPLGKKIQQVLKEKVSPGLASHGGYADMVDLKEGKVFLYFGGGCQGCSQASVTVKQGIEKILLGEFPELSAVIDVTDHSIGNHPFYK